MNNDYFLKGCREIIRELTRLIDTGHTMNRDEFGALAESGKFMDFLINGTKGFVYLEYFNKKSTLFVKENWDYINDAFGRHDNVILNSDYGLSDNANAYLLAINITVDIMGEIKRTDP